MAETVFTSEVRPFEDGEGGIAFVQERIVRDFKLGQRVVPGFTIVSAVGETADDLRYVSPLSSHPTIDAARAALDRK